MPRLFLAVDICEAVRERVFALMEQLRPQAGAIKWITRNQLHITTNFLGDVSQDCADEIRDALLPTARACLPFEIEVKGAGAFPSLRRPSILWLGVQRGASSLCGLQNELAQAINVLGFAPEARVYTPHLTIGRLPRGARPTRELPDLLAQHADFAAGNSPVGELVLYESELAASGPLYRALHRLRFGCDGKP